MFTTIQKQWDILPRWLQIVLGRLLLVVPQMFGVLLVTFFLIRLLPGDPAVLLLGNMATPEAVAQLRERLGLNHSVWIQFADYIRHIFQGDLGISIFTSNPVTTDLLDRAPATLELIGYSLVLMVVTAIVLAVASAVWRGSFIDIFVRIYGLAAGAIPDFWIGLLLIFFFYSLLGWAAPPFGRLDAILTPPHYVTGFYTIDSLLAGDMEAFRSSVGRLILPVLTLAIVNAGALMKMTHSIFSGVWGSEFVQHGRACGLSEFQLVRMALRNSLPPIITIVGFITGFLLGSAVLVETIFSWGGLGQYAVQAVINSDYPALQGFILVAAVFVLLVYLVVDILYELADPRIRA
ncbi:MULTISPECIES: ABC transporter permease [Klebsiella]|uniref:ABC transporter permease n=1 Tax=Klebsiella TaxID=570 RepID=UPI000741BEDE|nr:MULTISPECIES: ABC transporter permease [Klebsiella]MDU5892257.1 ABC transporter permease [Atopobium minutum]HCQ8039653.1 ABC transporter permease [Klebsiella quasipneumoniae subsp. quasipneumoniae]HEF8933358.1 ABC transporter permease [Klebsiella pneumoniae]KSY08461.1 ABC transporter permease [Klebsiella quasipneumoniae]MBL6032536.1 ABC transporter permease [Klebsiella michiganensis]